MVSHPRRHLIRRGQDRRVQRTPLHYPERRSGFDRRTVPGWRGRYLGDLRDFANRPRTVVLVLATIIVFNFMDFYLTVRILNAGGVEVNPIMERLFAVGSQTAAVVKLGIVGAAALVLLALRRYRRTLELSLALLVSFSMLMLYHVVLVIQLGA